MNYEEVLKSCEKAMLNVLDVETTRIDYENDYESEENEENNSMWNSTYVNNLREFEAVSFNAIVRTASAFHPEVDLCKLMDDLNRYSNDLVSRIVNKCIN